MTDNNTLNQTGHPSPSAANESTLQPPGDVPQSPRCLNRTGHAADRCQLRPQPTAVGQTTTVTPRSGPGGTTSSGMVISVGVNHTWHYGNPATVAVQIPTVVIETPTVAVQIRNKPKRRRRKRPDKAAKRARLAADQTNSQDPTPAGVKTEDTGGNMKREAP